MTSLEHPWQSYIDFLHACAVGTNEEREAAYAQRLYMYERIRAQTELAFVGFDDDIPRWIAWLEADKSRTYAARYKRDLIAFFQMSRQEKEDALKFYEAIKKNKKKRT